MSSIKLRELAPPHLFSTLFYGKVKLMSTLDVIESNSDLYVSDLSWFYLAFDDKEPNRILIEKGYTLKEETRVVSRLLFEYHMDAARYAQMISGQQTPHIYKYKYVQETTNNSVID